MLKAQGIVLTADSAPGFDNHRWRKTIKMRIQMLEENFSVQVLTSYETVISIINDQSNSKDVRIDE